MHSKANFTPYRVKRRLVVQSHYEQSENKAAVVAWHFGFPRRLRAVLGHQTTPERNMEGGQKEIYFHRSCREPQLKTK